MNQDVRIEAHIPHSHQTTGGGTGDFDEKTKLRRFKMLNLLAIERKNSTLRHEEAIEKRKKVGW